MPTIPLTKSSQEAAESMLRLVKNGTRHERQEGEAKIIEVIGEWEAFDPDEADMWGGHLKFVFKDNEATSEEDWLHDEISRSRARGLEGCDQGIRDKGKQVRVLSGRARETECLLGHAKKDSPLSSPPKRRSPTGNTGVPPHRQKKPGVIVPGFFFGIPVCEERLP